ncbi:MAG: hypothetical protein M1828_005067 [Chrysothrix sp. TS-e1954]|nr:MAG: hypothetical protein M1828_005067 [Chrysothrix sp. TS-e1954]
MSNSLFVPPGEQPPPPSTPTRQDGPRAGGNDMPPPSVIGQSPAVPTTTDRSALKELIQRVQLMPPELWGQPRLAIPICARCVRRLARFQAAIDHEEGWEEALRAAAKQGTFLCSGSAAGKKCSYCRAPKSNHKCVPVPPEYTRATNVLIYALRYGVEVERSGTTPITLQACDDFANELVKSMNYHLNAEWKERRRQAVLVQSTNILRWEKGLGLLEPREPNNILIDVEFDRKVRHLMSEKALSLWVWGLS